LKAIVESLENIPGSAKMRKRMKNRWDRGSKWILEKQGTRANGVKTDEPKAVPV
jgi:hypothetical protein